MVILKRIAALSFLLLFVGLGLLAFWALWPVAARFEAEPLLEAAAAYEARILRDTYGVPHVYGERDVDVAYGLAYAHAEDDFLTIQKVMLATRGELARLEGKEAAPIDYMVQLLGFWEDVEAGYARELSPEARALAEAYAAGINHYAALHRQATLPGLIPATGKDVVAGFAFKMPLFYGFDRALLELFEDERQRALALAPTEQAFRLVPGLRPPLGSNAVAVAPGRSADGATRLLVNSHQPYTGPVAWYEVRLHSEEGWDVAGGVFPGSPVMLHGHNRQLGWASTVNRPDLVDVYVLETDPENPDRYRFGEGWRELETREVELEVRILGRLTWTVTREVARSVHGPVVRTPHGTYALRYAGMGEIRHLDQYLRMNKARDFAAWREAMAMQAIPSLNFVYADRAGHVASFYNALFPRREPGWDWQAYLPGDRPDLVWQESWPFEALPQVVDPPSGFVVSSNHTPFRTTRGEGNPDPAAFPARLGIESRMTNRARRALQLYGGDPSITREEFRAYKYDKRYAEGSRVRELVEELLAADLPEDLEAARQVLARWRFTAEVDDPSAALAILTLSPVVLAERNGEPPPDLVESLRQAVETLERHHGRLDPPWGEVNRFRRGHLDRPVGGGPDVLRAIESFELEDDGTYSARSGDSFILFVEWGADGSLRSESVHQFGSATLDPTSPHFADQVPLFLAEETKRVWWEEAALRPHVTRAYRPGAAKASDASAPDETRP